MTGVKQWLAAMPVPGGKQVEPGRAAKKRPSRARVKKLDPSRFTAREAICDPEVRALMRLAGCVPDPASTLPRCRTGEVVVFLEDGTPLEHREDVDRGHAERPLDGPATRAKHRENVRRSFHPEAVHGLEGFVLSIDSQPEMRAVEPLVTPEPLSRTASHGTHP